MSTAAEIQLKDETTRAQVIAACGKAIVHTLNQIRERPEVRYQLGFGTQAFVLLTEAAALLFDEPVEKIQEFYGRKTMIKIFSIHRKIEVGKDGVSIAASDDACNVVLMVTGEEQRNKARFLLTPEESEKLSVLTNEIETRIGTLLTADYVPPAQAEPEGDLLAAHHEQADAQTSG